MDLHDHYRHLTGALIKDLTYDNAGKLTIKWADVTKNDTDITLTGITADGVSLATTDKVGGIKLILDKEATQKTLSTTAQSDGTGYFPVYMNTDGTLFAAVVQKDTTYSTFGPASASAAGTIGLVPAPAAGKQSSYLRGDGTWVAPTNSRDAGYGKIDLYDSAGTKKTANYNVSASTYNETLKLKEGANIELTATNSSTAGSDLLTIAVKDVMTTSHAANAITSGDITNWNAVHTWYTAVAGTAADGVIDNWNEIKNFVDGFKESDDLATYLANNYLAKTAGVTATSLFTGASAATSASASKTNGNAYINLTKTVNGTTSNVGSVLIKGTNNVAVTIDENGAIVVTGPTLTSYSTTDEKVKTVAAAASTKYYLVGKANAADTNTGVTSTNVYLKDGKLFSNNTEVLTGHLTIYGLAILDSGTAKGTFTANSKAATLNFGTNLSVTLANDVYTINATTYTNVDTAVKKTEYTGALSTDWLSTGISPATNNTLTAGGTYAVQVYGATSGQYIASGVMSWNTNGSDEVALHQLGSGTARIYLKINAGKFYLAASAAITSQKWTIAYRRIL